MKLRLIDKQAAFTLSILLSLIANAQNPIISQRYTADPHRTGVQRQIICMGISRY